MHSASANDHHRELKLADEHLADGERVVSRQREFIAELATKGHDTAGAEAALDAFERALAALRRQRDAIAAAA
jgi:hypothetical protein